MKALTLVDLVEVEVRDPEWMDDTYYIVRAQLPSDITREKLKGILDHQWSSDFEIVAWRVSPRRYALVEESPDGGWVVWHAFQTSSEMAEFSKAISRS